MTREDAMGRAVQILVDRAEIQSCLNRYARGMDRHDRAMVRSCYHDGAIDVHGSQAFGVEAFLDWAFAYHEPQLHHQHYISNFAIDVTGDAAHSECYYLFVARYADRGVPLTMAGGRYVDRLERRDGRWAISTRVCTAEWRATPESKLPDRGSPRVAPEVRVSHDRSDVSYVRPLEFDLLPRPG
jgi:hypothetical protein